MKEPTTATQEGVSSAFTGWLSQHPLSVPEVIEAAVEKAVTAWLEANEDRLIEAITAAAPEATDAYRLGYRAGAQRAATLLQSREGEAPAPTACDCGADLTNTANQGPSPDRCVNCELQLAAAPLDGGAQ